MTRMEHAGGADRPGAAPEMASRVPFPRLSQRAGGKDYVSSNKLPQISTTAGLPVLSPGPHLHFNSS